MLNLNPLTRVVRTPAGKLTVCSLISRVLFSCLFVLNDYRVDIAVHSSYRLSNEIDVNTPEIWRVSSQPLDRG